MTTLVGVKYETNGRRSSSRVPTKAAAPGLTQSMEPAAFSQPQAPSRGRRHSHRIQSAC
ncbi:hypothetical protein LY78DRAFT_651133 [Colletotrichum sublineola]|nr:hypothetical protein LY78DRAFT_651133 [Colletotrichum sublineola]